MTVNQGSVEWLDLEQFSDAPMFNIKAVIQQTGIAGPTLRSWERRYDLLLPVRDNKAYRLYSERNIVLLRWLKERVESGLAISQAIALFHHLHEEYKQLSNLSGSSPATPAADPSTLWSFEVSPRLQEPEQVSGKEERLPVYVWPRLDSSSSRNSFPATPDMNLVRNPLIEAFRYLDEHMATMLMGSMLSIYPLEQVCSELITPTMWQIGQMRAEGQLSTSVEHFAYNFFRNLLANLTFTTPMLSTAPLVIVGCAPGELHALASYILALFLRRAGMRVVNLGQSVEIAGLLHTIKKFSPVLVCISLTMQTYLPALINLGSEIQKMPLPRPIFVFGGQAFTHDSHMIAQIHGVYLSGDLNVIVVQLQHMIAEEVKFLRKIAVESDDKT